MDNFEKQKNTLDYNSLKENLLNGAQSFKEVYLKLLEADQSTGMHEAANDNLQFLEDNQVRDLIMSQSKEVQGRYFRFLGFTQWHIAQSLMFENKTSEGLKLFKKSIENSIRGDDVNSEWVAYGIGTVAYLESDIEGLKNSIPKVFSGKNKAILERMLVRLEKGENPDYKLDY